ncbi:MAG: tetratricopeptide repeat protein [Candidatus Riflebacteria bacterium]|nr:tetratricopeptide repeat protein [Candidatus Riflebacteria bacterium]
MIVVKKIFLPLLLSVFWAYPAFAYNAKMHVDIGLNHFYKHRYLDAYKEFKKAAELDPEYPEARYNLGRVYKNQGFIKEAISEFQIAVALKPDYLAARRELDSLLTFLEENAAASAKIQGREAYTNTGASQAISAREAERRGQAALNDGNYAEAARYYDLAVKSNPDELHYIKMLGFVYFKQGRYFEAMEQYNKALEKSPSDPELSYSIGAVYLKQNYLRQAERAFERALSLRPDMLKSVFALGETYEAMDLQDKALFYYKKALELNPNLKEAKTKVESMTERNNYEYFKRGAYFYQAGEHAKAAPYLRMALSGTALSRQQRNQAEEMLAASSYWVQREEQKEQLKSEMQQITQKSYLGRDVTVKEAASNPAAYMGCAIEWEGKLEYISKEDDWAVAISINSDPSVNADTNMEHVFLALLPEALPGWFKPKRFIDVTVKGKILKVQKLFNDNSKVFSRNLQPVVAVTEITLFDKSTNFPLTIRF